MIASAVNVPSCFSCNEKCSDESRLLYAGDIEGKPGENFMEGERANSFLLGRTVQPKGGGGFTPTLQIMDRGDGLVDTAAKGWPYEGKEFAVAKGPCCFGGCSELCFSSEFGISTNAETVELGDYAKITKKKPKSLGQAAREGFTDADIYEVDFFAKEITPEQKANVLSSMVHLDYMFFERDNDMCKYENDGCSIVLFNCFIYGCVCPCKLHLSNNSGGS